MMAWKLTTLHVHETKAIFLMIVWFYKVLYQRAYLLVPGQRLNHLIPPITSRRLSVSLNMLCKANAVLRTGAT